MNVTLVNSFDSNVYQNFKRLDIKDLPLGLAYIAGQLEKDGHNVTVIDPIVDGLDSNETMDRIIESNPLLVGTSATTPIIGNALEILKEVKHRDSNIYTVIGGPHISATPLETLENNKDFLDFVVFGEGEHTISELVMSLDKGYPLKSISGLGFVDNRGLAKINEKRQLERDLNSFAFPARHLFPVDKYINKVRFEKDDTPHISLTSSRGCVGKCTFCGSQTTWGKRVRFRSVQNIIDEIKQCHNDFGSNNFIFADDTFTTNRKHVIDMCKEIIDLPYSINIFCSSRVDTIDEEKLDWLKKAGCYCITYGIESGDNEILKAIGKNTTVDMIENAINITKQAGIETHGSFIIGNLGDTKETIEKTIQLAFSLDLNEAQFTILVPLPGTVCYEQAIKLKAFRCNPTDYKSFFFYYSVVANLTKDVSDEELIDIQRGAYKRWNENG